MKLVVLIVLSRFDSIADFYEDMHFLLLSVSLTSFFLIIAISWQTGAILLVIAVLRESSAVELIVPRGCYREHCNLSCSRSLKLILS